MSNIVENDKMLTKVNKENKHLLLFSKTNQKFILIYSNKIPIYIMIEKMILTSKVKLKNLAKSSTMTSSFPDDMKS